MAFSVGGTGVFLLLALIAVFNIPVEYDEGYNAAVAKALAAHDTLVEGPTATRKGVMLVRGRRKYAPRARVPVRVPAQAESASTSRTGMTAT
jgi:hypothetical protein